MTQSASKLTAPTPSTPTTSGSSSSSSSSSSGSPVQMRALRGMDFGAQSRALTPEGAAPVQAKGEATGDVHAAAERGTAGSGGALPHLDTIQAAFGHHDVSQVQAHVGGAASEASAAMGAEAYATGNHVAFGGGGPDLHTAAHEAAHTVQQQAGVSLSGGVGQVGDRYEQHADQVADAVVQGKSAEGLLDSMGGGGGGASVQQRAVQRSPTNNPPVTQGANTIQGANGHLQVTPALKQTDPPENFVSSVGRYNTNFETVKGNIGQRGGTPDQVTRFEAKKGDWYHRWGVAALQAAADAPAALQEFQNIRGDLVNMFPDDSPGAGGGHLYTGYAAGGSGRTRAEESSAQANATNNAGGGGGGGGSSNATPPQTNTPPQNANPGGGGSNTPPASQGITHRTLETTLVGNLFDGVAQNKKPAAEQAKWIPYGGSQAAQWWSHVSAEYANTFTGDVHAHIDVGFGYYVKSLIVDANPGAPRATLAAKLPEVIKLHPSVFRDDELPRIAALMGDGKVTALVAHLRCETSPGQVKSTSPSIPVAGITDGASLIAAVDQALRAFVQPSELEANLPPDPAPTNNATPPPVP